MAAMKVAGAEKRHSTEQRNTVTMRVTATQDSTSEWRELGAHVTPYAAKALQSFIDFPDRLSAGLWPISWRSVGYGGFPIDDVFHDSGLDCVPINCRSEPRIVR
jgi:hypothetical protein